jgi:hypothetical protein
MKLGAYKLTTINSSCCIFPFFQIEWKFLSLLIDLDLKSTFSNINVDIPACFSGPLLEKSYFPFTLSQCLFLPVRFTFCRQQIVRCFFLNQITNMCLLIGKSRPLTFSVNIGNSCYVVVVCVCVCVFVFDYLLCFTHVSAHLVRFIYSNTFLAIYILSSVFKIPLSIFCNAGLVVIYCFSFLFIMEGYYFSFNYE